jgi:transposase
MLPLVLCRTACRFISHLGEPRGQGPAGNTGRDLCRIIGSDDHSAYNSYHKNRRRQLCWAHLIRKLKALRDDRSSPHAYCFIKKMLQGVGAIFSCWHAFQRSGGSREQLWLDTPPMREYCAIFLYSTDPLVITRAKRTLANGEYLFTFLIYEGVEPTNNIAERAIRPSVQWRKICFGSQSDTGLRFTERMLSIVGTCRLHGVNPYHFLTKVICASLSGKDSLPDLSRLLQK